MNLRQLSVTYQLALIYRTARGAKVKHLTDTVKVPGLEFAQVDDVAKSDFTGALNGTRLDAVSTLWVSLLI